jgi:DUF4097 and DUF4098 domain-containing protein YvlB
MRAERPSQRDDDSWSVSYDVYVLNQANLVANTENGGISADNVRGEMNFEATNGGATVYVPRGYNAQLETGTPKT